MTPFQVTFYYINNEREIEILEKSFLDIKNQLDLYERQHSNTIESYLKSRQEEIDTLKERFVKVEEAQKRYDKVIHAGSQITDASILKLVKTYSHSFHYNEENQFLRFISPKFTKDFFNLLNNFYEELL